MSILIAATGTILFRSPNDLLFGGVHENRNGGVQHGLHRSQQKILLLTEKYVTLNNITSALADFEYRYILPVSTEAEAAAAVASASFGLMIIESSIEKTNIESIFLNLGYISTILLDTESSMESLDIPHACPRLAAPFTRPQLEEAWDRADAFRSWSQQE